MKITCSIEVLAEHGPVRYEFTVGTPAAAEVVGQQMHLVLIDRSDGLQLKAYGFDLLDVYESALQIIRMNVESAAGAEGKITWH